MCALFYPRVKVFSLLATLALFFLTGVKAEAAWSIQQFEVFAGAPYVRDDGVMEAIGFDWAEAEDFFPDFDRAQVEKALNEAAAWYSNEGFPEPVIEPVVQTDSGPAYRVYVCSEAFVSLYVADLWQKAKSFFRKPEAYMPHWSSCGSSYGSDDSNWAAYAGPCSVSDGARPVMYINADGAAFKDGKLTAEGYQTVAHELFHAIQANTVMGRSPNPCDRSMWIGEGQADAISMHLLDTLWKTLPQPTTQPELDGWLNKKWGIRPYHTNLTEDAKGYATSSFWGFLAVLNGGYDYLLTSDDGMPGVFDFEIEKSGDWRSEVSWLDAGLLARFDMRLNELLGLFMNDVSMHIAPQSWTSNNAYKDWPRWVKGILGECENITLSDRNASHEFFLRINPVAGSCAWLTVNVPQATVQVSFQAASVDVSLFKDIWIGLAEGDTIVTQAMMAGTSPSDPSRKIGIWANFTVRTGSPTLFTFTNAADDPDGTERQVVNIEISFNSSTNNLRGAAPAGPGRAAQPAVKPDYKKSTRTLQKRKSATTAMITEQKNLDKEALSPYATGSTSVAMRPKQPPCEDPFKYTACGPSTRIRMDLMPGTWANLGQSAGTGGAAGQVFSSMMSQALSNPFDTTQVVEGLKAKVESIDGGIVSISIPFIDYGYTGSVDNASIVTRVGGELMRAFGPPDSTGNTPLTGRVNITEFTPFRMSGSYTAPLAYFEASPVPDQPAIYKRGPTMSGTFNQVAPWLDDGRVQHIQLQSHEEIADDIGKALGVPAGTMRALKEQGTIPGVGGSSGGPPTSGDGSSGFLDGNDCDCDCANKGKVDDLCEFFCEEEFAACP